MMTSSLDLLKWWCWRCSVFHWLGQPLPVWRPDSFYCYLIADVWILLRAGSFSDLLLGSTPAPSAECAASALLTNSRKQRINQRQFGFTLPSFTALMHISTLIQLKEWKEREKKKWADRDGAADSTLQLHLPNCLLIQLDRVKRQQRMNSQWWPISSVWIQCHQSSRTQQTQRIDR